MDQWPQCLLATWEPFLEDDEEDDFNVHWVMGLGLKAQPRAIPNHVRGSRPRKPPNIDKHRHEMHTCMMSDYFAN